MLAWVTLAVLLATRLIKSSRTLLFLPRAFTDSFGCLADPWLWQLLSGECGRRHPEVTRTSPLLPNNSLAQTWYRGSQRHFRLLVALVISTFLLRFMRGMHLHILGYTIPNHGNCFSGIGWLFLHSAMRIKRSEIKTQSILLMWPYLRAGFYINYQHTATHCNG